MTNHVHLLVTPQDGEGCPVLMKALAQRYSFYFNKRCNRTGALWEARYHASPILSAEYLLACMRYIELNPVHAGLASQAVDYPWSSCATNLGLRTNDVITPHLDFVAFGRDAYAELLRDPADEELVSDRHRL